MSNPYEPPSSEGNSTSPSHEPTIGQNRLATRWERFCGSVVDALIVGGVSIGIAYAIGLYNNLGENGQLPLKEHVLGIVVGIVTFFVFNIVLIYSRGQTLGKLMIGTRVVTLDGQQVSGNRYLFARLLPIWILTSLPVFCIPQIVGLIDALLIFRNERNCLHDDIAQTRVIKL